MSSLDHRIDDPQSTSDRLFDAFVRHHVGVLRFGGGAAIRAVRAMDLDEAELRIELREALERLRGTAADQRRLERAIEKLLEGRVAAWERASQSIENDVAAMAEKETDYTEELIASILLALLIRPKRIETQRAVTRSRIFGETLRERFAAARFADAKAIRAAVHFGRSLRESAADITRRVFGSRSARGADGVTAAARRGVDALARAAVVNSSMRARDAMFAANLNLEMREQFIAVLDSRTTPICRGFSARTFPLGAGPRPPLHFRCRSTVVPYRVADGPPSDVSYEDFLSRQPREFVEEVLGVTKARLFRQGGLKLDRFADPTGREFTLSDLARMHAKNFRAAGLDPSRFADRTR